MIAWHATRDKAIATLAQTLANPFYGVETNRRCLQQILAFAPFTAGEPWTRSLEQLSYQAATVEVLSAGTQTSMQDYRGRLGDWAVSVPPSGPMDDRALRSGNRAGLFRQQKHLDPRSVWWTCITVAGYQHRAPNSFNQPIIASLPGWLSVRCGHARK